jgi:cardiolipin synthase
MNPSNIPNLLTIARILLVAPIVWLLLDEQFGMALTLFFIAGVSDGLDGFLAKKMHWESWLGTLLDPIADKLLLISSYVTLAWLGFLPTWLVVLVLLRDLIIVTGATAYYFRIEKIEAAPTIVSKLNTLLQILLVLLVIAGQIISTPVGGLIQAMVYIVAVTTAWSGVEYVYTWGRRAQLHTRATRHD